MWWFKIEALVKKIFPGSGPQDTGKQTMKKKCAGNHTNHICALAEKNNFEEIKNLTGKPRYVCVNCGRVADDENSICNPFAFERIPGNLPHMY